MSIPIPAPNQTEGLGLAELEDWARVTAPREMARRVELVRACNESAKLRALVRARCANDPGYWFENWCFCYDPRLSGVPGLSPHLPFMPFPKQIELVSWIFDIIRRGRNAMVEKSRDEGGSTIFAFCGQHQWQFVDGAKWGFGSRKLDLVDKLGDMDSIFEKIRYNYARQPWFLRPLGFNPDEHDKLGLIVNPLAGSQLSGEGGDQIGAGGRCTVRVMDEAARIDRAEKVDAAVSNTSRVVFYLSSASGGMSTLFARKRHSGRYPVFRLHWKDDPRKGPNWYRQQREDYDAITVAHEVDIDYSASIEGVAIPTKWVQAAVLGRQGSYWEHRRPDPGIPRCGGLDVADEGDAENVFVTRAGPLMLGLESWTGSNTTQTALRALSYAEAAKCEGLNFDSIGVGAGCSAAYAELERPTDVKVEGVNWGRAAGTRALPDAPRMPAKDRFLNLRAEWWYRVALRFRWTFESLEALSDPSSEAIQRPDEDLIAILPDDELITQLSAPRWEYTSNGRVKLEGKASMRRRGIKSPDRADACVYAYNDARRFVLLIGGA